jgi:hypothetical protein
VTPRALDIALVFERLEPASASRDGVDGVEIPPPAIRWLRMPIVLAHALERIPIGVEQALHASTSIAVRRAPGGGTAENRRCGRAGAERTGDRSGSS